MTENYDRDEYIIKSISLSFRTSMIVIVLVYLVFLIARGINTGGLPLSLNNNDDLFALISCIFILAIIFAALLRLRIHLFLFRSDLNGDKRDEYFIVHMRKRSQLLHFVIFFLSFIGLFLSDLFQNMIIALPFIIFTIVSFVYLRPDRKFVKLIYKKLFDIPSTSPGTQADR